MKKMRCLTAVLTGIVLSTSCSHPPAPYLKGSYGYDAAFLKAHAPGTVELQSPDSSARLLLSAAFQGRVMTSTATGDTGTSFGWLNYDLLAAPQKKKQFNPVGGEERFWLGPEGGQYSLYFKAGDSFNIAHWQVPALVDTIPWQLASSDASHAVFTQQASLSNWSGTVFQLGIERSIHLLDKKELEDKLQSPLPAGLRFVAFETTNTVTNTGSSDWTPSTGLPSIWLLGMFTPSDQTTVIIPFEPIPNAASYITSTYFGAVPPERLRIKDSILLFTCDGKYRSKIGLAPPIAKPIAGSFDAAKNLLTIILPQIDKTAPYVNSKWELQKEPYKGDVVNSYNDGPLANGTRLGPFYEVESSSPALLLKKGEKGIYKQTTCHFSGSPAALRELAMKLLGVDLNAKYFLP
jgi:hypothetical protein